MKVKVIIEYKDEVYESHCIFKEPIDKLYSSEVADMASAISYTLFSQVFHDFVQEPECHRHAKEVQNDENIKDFDKEDE